MSKIEGDVDVGPDERAHLMGCPLAPSPSVERKEAVPSAWSSSIASMLFSSLRPPVRERQDVARFVDGGRRNSQARTSRHVRANPRREASLRARASALSADDARVAIFGR